VDQERVSNFLAPMATAVAQGWWREMAFIGLKSVVGVGAGVLWEGLQFFGVDDARILHQFHLDCDLAIFANIDLLMIHPFVVDRLSFLERGEQGVDVDGSGQNEVFVADGEQCFHEQTGQGYSPWFSQTQRSPPQWQIITPRFPQASHHWESSYSKSFGSSLECWVSGVFIAAYLGHGWNVPLPGLDSFVGFEVGHFEGGEDVGFGGGGDQVARRVGRV
jgi:hypothetical protein